MHKVWPIHCEIGTWGHNVHNKVRLAYNRWEEAHNTIVKKVAKGTSLLETDLYKFTMWQALLHSHPAAEAEYAFVCRNAPAFPLSELKSEVERELEALCSLTFTQDELAYLRGLRFIKGDFVKGDFVDFSCLAMASPWPSSRIHPAKRCARMLRTSPTFGRCFASRRRA